MKHRKGEQPLWRTYLCGGNVISVDTSMYCFILNKKPSSEQSFCNKSSSFLKISYSWSPSCDCFVACNVLAYFQGNW
jgi:hypothetical protein